MFLVNNTTHYDTKKYFNFLFFACKKDVTKNFIIMNKIVNKGVYGSKTGVSISVAIATGMAVINAVVATVVTIGSLFASPKDK
jgi:hypothetical protein